MKHTSQPEFVDFYLPFGGKLDPDNRWVKLAALVPRDQVEDESMVWTPSLITDQDELEKV